MWVQLLSREQLLTIFIAQLLKKHYIVHLLFTYAEVVFCLLFYYLCDGDSMCPTLFFKTTLRICESTSFVLNTEIEIHNRHIFPDF